MNFKIIKLIVINIIFVNCLNIAFSSELILPKNKPLKEKYDLELNKVNFLLPKEKPTTTKVKTEKEQTETKEKHSERARTITQSRRKRTKGIKKYESIFGATRKEI